MDKGCTEIGLANTAYPMGLSLPAAKKRRIYPTTVVAASVREQYYCENVGALSVDVNAAFRSWFPYNPTHIVGNVETPWSPEKMVDQVLLPRLFSGFNRANTSLRFVALCFDDSSRIPEARLRFYATRRYAAVAEDAKPPAGCVRHGERFYRAADVPISDEDAAAITTTHLPRSWSAVLNSGAGKKRLFEVIADVCCRGRRKKAWAALTCYSPRDRFCATGL